jgi:hypothetical protein
MPLTVSFTAESVSGEPQNILFTDTSTGSDGTITSRRIYVSDKDGNFLVEEGTATEYELWPIPLSDTITLDLLTKDYAVKIVVQWLNVSNVVVYDSTIDAIGFTEYNENFDYELTQRMTANPMLINDNRFWYNKVKLRTYINSGNNAITQDSDLVNAQLCYNAATDLRINGEYYFNGNG